jgi:hypothetical protein
MPKQLSSALASPLTYVSHAVVPIASAIGGDISAAFRKLLEEKHLYQSVEVGRSSLEAILPELLSAQKPKRAMAGLALVAGSGSPPLKEENFIYTGQSLLSQHPWVPNLESQNTVDAAIASVLKKGEASMTIPFALPQTVHTHCKVCKKAWPFNPVLHLGKTEYSYKSSTDQWFFLAYMCQSCKTEPVRFLVRRHGCKLRLCGRDPMGEVTVPDALPVSSRNHFSSALVAYNAGQTLAGIFLLRVFIEQFWRIHPNLEAPLAADPRLTGETMGELYNTTLPNDFKLRFPSLSGIYSDLSAAIHTADPNAELFQKSESQITEHFEARRLFRLTDEKKKAEVKPS